MKRAQRLEQIVAEVTEVVSRMTAMPRDEIRDSDALEDLLAVDSLNIAILSLELEDRFGIVIPSEDMVCINDIAEYVYDRLRNQE